MAARVIKMASKMATKNFFSATLRVLPFLKQIVGAITIFVWDKETVVDIYKLIEAALCINTSKMAANVTKMASKMATENVISATLSVLPFLKRQF
jgi:hypothetical protein